MIYPHVYVNRYLKKGGPKEPWRLSSPKKILGESIKYNYNQVHFSQKLFIFKIFIKTLPCLETTKKKIWKVYFFWNKMKKLLFLRYNSFRFDFFLYMCVLEVLFFRHVSFFTKTCKWGLDEYIKFMLGFFVYYFICLGWWFIVWFKSFWV